MEYKKFFAAHVLESCTFVMLFIRFIEAEKRKMIDLLVEASKVFRKL